MRGAVLGLLMLSVGCTDPGLYVVDAGVEDGGMDAGDADVDGALDAAIDSDAPDADVPDAPDSDASLTIPCAFGINSRLPGDLPMTFDDGCRDVTVIPSGVTRTPFIREAFDGGYQVLAFSVATLGTSAQLTISFGGPVQNLHFRFDLLSFRASGTDERLQIEVDGLPVTPRLSESSRTRVEGGEVRSSGPNGAGRIDVATAENLVIRLLDVGSATGLGIEIIEVRYERLR